MEHLDIVSLLLRMVAGTLFFFQGYDKIFKVKIENVVRTFSSPGTNAPLSPGFFRFIIAVSSWAELIGGAALFIGLFKFYALAVLSVDLLFVAFAFSAMKAMWDMQFYFPRFVFVLALWSIPFSQDHYSLDSLLKY